MIKQYCLKKTKCSTTRYHWWYSDIWQNSKVIFGQKIRWFNDIVEKLCDMVILAQNLGDMVIFLQTLGDMVILPKKFGDILIFRPPLGGPL